MINEKLNKRAKKNRISFAILGLTTACIVFTYMFTFFSESGRLKGKEISKNLRYVLWLFGILIVTSMGFIIFEFFDSHFYIYDIAGCLLIGFMAPLASLLLFGFKVRN